jgi:hypothetical protein
MQEASKSGDLPRNIIKRVSQNSMFAHNTASETAESDATMAKSLNGNGSESEFEFIETPKAPTPSFEKFEDCGVPTTSVSLTGMLPPGLLPRHMNFTPSPMQRPLADDGIHASSILPSKMDRSQPTLLDPTASRSRC